MKKEILFSFIVNMIGIVSLYLVDISILKSNNQEIVSQWALTKSILFIGVIFILIGIDQAVVRLKLDLKSIYIPALIQFFFMSAVLTLITTYLYKELNFYFIFLSLFLLALSYLMYASFRLKLHYIKAQFFLQGWKIIFLILLFLTNKENYIIVIPFSLFIIVLVFYKDSISSFGIGSLDLSNFIKVQKTGLHYFISLLTLTLSLYMDQLLLNIDHKIPESNILFMHITFYAGPVLILLGFSGFIIGPYLRNNPDRKWSFLKKIYVMYIFIAILIAIISHILGDILIHYFHPDVELNYFVAYGVMGVVILRYLYILPSAYIGSFATNMLIRDVSYVNILAIFIYLAIYFSVSKYSSDYLLAIVFAMLSLWIIRVINGYYAIYKIYKEERK